MAKQTNESGPLTTAFSWQVRQGCESKFEAWIGEFTAAATHFPGERGSEVIFAGTDLGEYRVIFRFDTYTHLRTWLESNICRELLKKAEAFRESEPRVSWRLTPFFGRQPQALQAMFLAAGMILLFTWLIMPVLVQILRP